MFYIENIKNTIAKKIKEENLSVSSLEKRLGVSRGLIQKILIGKSQNPTLETLASLATVFGSSLDELVFGQKREDTRVLDEKIWDTNIMSVIFNETCYFISENKIEPSFKKIITLMLEMYDFFLKENNSIFDKKFFDWYIKKELL